MVSNLQLQPPPFRLHANTFARARTLPKGYAAARPSTREDRVSCIQQFRELFGYMIGGEIKDVVKEGASVQDSFARACTRPEGQARATRGYLVFDKNEIELSAE